MYTDRVPLTGGRGGLPSTWLADRLALGDSALVYVHQNPRFRLPSVAAR